MIIHDVFYPSNNSPLSRIFYSKPSSQVSSSKPSSRISSSKPSSRISSSKPPTRDSGNKANWIANSEDIKHIGFKENYPLPDLLWKLQRTLGYRHHSIDRLCETLFSAGLTEEEVEKKITKFCNMDYSGVLQLLDDNLAKPWPANDSACLQKIILPANSQIAALSGSKRSRSMYLQPNQSSSDSKRQKKVTKV
jgi:hypothetical protein